MPGGRVSGVWVRSPAHLDPASDLRYLNVLATDTAQAFWALLLPHGLKGGALSHVHSTDEDEDDDMGEEEGWRPEYVDWWFEFLTQKGGKGISKDTWVMVCLFPNVSSQMSF